MLPATLHCTPKEMARGIRKHAGRVNPLSQVAPSKTADMSAASNAAIQLKGANSNLTMGKNMQKMAAG